MNRAAILAAAISILAGCASAPHAPQTARCTEQPQWQSTDPQGRPIGIYVCFGDDQTLRYQVQPLPPAPATEKK